MWYKFQACLPPSTHVVIFFIAITVYFVYNILQSLIL